MFSAKLVSLSTVMLCGLACAIQHVYTDAVDTRKTVIVARSLVDIIDRSLWYIYKDLRHRLKNASWIGRGISLQIQQVESERICHAKQKHSTFKLWCVTKVSVDFIALAFMISGVNVWLRE